MHTVSGQPNGAFWCKSGSFSCQSFKLSQIKLQHPSSWLTSMHFFRQHITSVTYFTWLCKLPRQCLCNSVTQSVILIIIVIVLIVVIIIILSVVGSWNTFVRWCAVGHWMSQTCISSCGRWMSVCTCLLRTCGHKSSVKHASQLR